jgi:hypothetical protein
MGDGTNADIARRTRALVGDPSIEFFRQAGGCLEIRQADPMGEEIDIVHVCDEAEFIAQLLEFVGAVPNRGVHS